MVSTAISEESLAAPETRKSRLEAYISNCVAHGWRVESQAEFSATLAKGNRTNHILHLILTIITLGVWAIVWILVALLGGEKRMAVRIDENGETQKS